jgi:hypothetical protein
MGAPRASREPITQPGENPPIGPSLPAALKHSGAGRAAPNLRRVGTQSQQRARDGDGFGTCEVEGKSGAGSGGNISDAAPRLGPARPARLNLIRVLGQQDVTRTRSPRSRFGVRLVRFPSGNLACARGRCLGGKELRRAEETPGWQRDVFDDVKPFNVKICNYI